MSPNLTTEGTQREYFVKQIQVRGQSASSSQGTSHSDGAPGGQQEYIIMSSGGGGDGWSGMNFTFDKSYVDFLFCLSIY